MADREAAARAIAHAAVRGRESFRGGCIERYLLGKPPIHGSRCDNATAEILAFADAETARLRGALEEAAQSLETLSQLAGRDEYLSDMMQIRGYANSRARIAADALKEPGK